MVSWLRVTIGAVVLVGALGMFLRYRQRSAPLAGAATARMRGPAREPGSSAGKPSSSADGSGFDLARLTSARIIRTAARSEALTATRIRMSDGEFDLVLVTQPKYVQILDRDATGKHLGSTAAVRRYVESDGHHLLMAMNAGMFQPSLEPVGLLVSRGSELASLNSGSGDGNFFLLPNGVFSVSATGFGVEDTTLFAAGWSARGADSLLAATQSGPLLLQDGLENPRFSGSSTHRVIRNGVGVDGRGQALFVISNTPVTFHELAALFASLGFRDALYLDGAISTLFLPALDRSELHMNLGPFIVVTD